MQTFDHRPYTYLIGWPSLNRWYYGVRYSKKCAPEDLWVSYFTSSRLVKKFVAQHGDPTVREVRKTFASIKHAQHWESRVLKKLKVVTDEKWINGHDTKAFDPASVPYGDAHWTKQNTEAARKWKSRENWNKKDSNWSMPKGQDHWTYKDTDSATKHRLRMTSDQNPNNLTHVRLERSERLKTQNPVNLPGVKEKISRSLFGRKRPRMICEICQKDVADSIYTKFHGTKCKNN
jgi:hypothetical protein